MDKQVITEEMHLEKEWYEEAKQQTRESLPAFIDKMMNQYDHDYGTVCHAIAACTLATLDVTAKEMGISGFQYSWIKFQILRHGWYKNNKTGLKILNYDDMIYPQKQDHYEKTISKGIFKNLQDLALEQLQENDPEDVHPEVYKHWQSIADGNVPFGYAVEEDS